MAFIKLSMRKILEVLRHHHAMPGGKQMLHHVRADVARATDDQNNRHHQTRIKLLMVYQ